MVLEVSPTPLDILRYESRVTTQEHMSALSNAETFRDEMISFLRQDETWVQLSALELGPDQKELFLHMFMCKYLQTLQHKSTHTWMKKDVPMLNTEWEYLPTQKEANYPESDLNSYIGETEAEMIRKQETRVINQLDKLVKNVFSLVVRWGVFPGNIPSFVLFGNGIYFMASDIIFLGFPTIPKRPEEAQDYYAKALTLNTNNPLFSILDDGHIIIIDWRDDDPFYQPTRYQELHHVGKLQSSVFGHQLEIFGTSDISGLRRQLPYAFKPSVI